MKMSEEIDKIDKINKIENLNSEYHHFVVESIAVFLQKTN